MKSEVWWLGRSEQHCSEKVAQNWAAADIMSWYHGDSFHRWKAFLVVYMQGDPSGAGAGAGTGDGAGGAPIISTATPSTPGSPLGPSSSEPAPVASSTDRLLDATTQAAFHHGHGLGEGSSAEPTKISSSHQTSPVPHAKMSAFSSFFHLGRRKKSDLMASTQTHAVSSAASLASPANVELEVLRNGKAGTIGSTNPSPTTASNPPSSNRSQSNSTTFGLSPSRGRSDRGNDRKKSQSHGGGAIDAVTTTPIVRIGQNQEGDPQLQTAPSASNQPLSPLSPHAPLPSRSRSPNFMSSGILDDAEGYIFGVPLEVAVRRAGKHGVPDIVLACIRHVEEKGLSFEGIYRIPGSLRRAREWGEKLEEAARLSVVDPLADFIEGTPMSTIGPVVSFEDESPTTVASLLKRFFLRIKGGLIGENFWKELDRVAAELNISCESNDPTPSEVASIRALLMSNLATVSHVLTVGAYFRHLHKVSTMGTVNKMSPQNLAIVTFPGGGVGAKILICWANPIFEDWMTKATERSPLSLSNSTSPIDPELSKPSIEGDVAFATAASANISSAPSAENSEEAVSKLDSSILPKGAAVSVASPSKGAAKQPAWVTEKPGEYSDKAFQAAKEEARTKLHVQELAAKGLLHSTNVATAVEN
ncbi:hypothetical protein DFJ73DRAFT_936177 [Zopfochytrium polystomum]|nr:hypothetical protein DFJ73DRAFT_936177 [Zopfochytrium polystomum]